MGITLNQLTNSISKVVTKLREEFTHSNISVLDKLSTSNNGYLLYDDKQVAGTGVLYRDETVLFEGGATTATLIDSIENYEYIDIYINYVDYPQLGYPEVRTVKVSHVIPYYGQEWMTTIPIGGSTTWKNCMLGMYFVDATTLVIGYNGSSASQIAKVVGVNYKAKQSYSLEEQIVGTWIDGKPLYQKTITGTMPGTTNVENMVDTGIENLDIGYIYDGYILSSHGTISSNSYYNYTANYLTLDGKLTVYTSQSHYINCPFVITIRYTKTTDAATITI